MVAALSQLVVLPPTPDGVEAMLTCCQYFYVSGNPQRALDAAEVAMRHARELRDAATLRKALTFLGIVQADLGDIGGAIESDGEALELSLALKDSFSELSVLNNLGVALLYAAQYDDAVATFERVIRLAGNETSQARIRASALGNIALACLHLEDLSRGLKASRQAVECSPEPTTASDCLNRVLLENHYTRLLLEVENLDKAKQRSELARKYAAASKSERADLQACIAEGLYEVHAGLIDMGLTRLQGALERARLRSSALRDALLAMVKALEVAGRPEEAVKFLRELMVHTRKVQQDNALLHHRRHLAQIEGDPDVLHASTDSILKRHEQVIEGQQAKQRLFKAQIEQLERLAVTAELRDDSTGEHSYRVGKLASVLGREFGCDEETLFMLDLAGRLHDIGKIGIPDGILLKPGRLTRVEREIMQTHTTVGAELLAKSDVPHMQMAEDIARFHHEWWDGNGYPTGISGTAIPLSARITALADVFDALTHKRPYKEPWPVARALDEIRRLRGFQFDPDLTDLFLQLIPRLQREVGDLDEYLGEAARQSPFTQARRKISETLRRLADEQGLQTDRFNPLAPGSMI
jgi:putative two-component system response regulator